MLILGMCSTNHNSPPAKSADQIKTETEKTNKLTKAIAAAITIKRAMRNPESFKIESAILMDNGSVCYQFISQNGFGGMNRMKAVHYGADNIKTSEMEGFSGKWNKECAKKQGEDIKDYLELALKN